MSVADVSAPLVVKFGGELLERNVEVGDRGGRSRLQIVTGAMARVAASRQPLVIVHGGGKEIDEALESAGIDRRQVDGLRITDESTLDVVVAVLGGTVNTRLVAALVTAGTAAVGLTGADGGCGWAEAAAAHRSVDGHVVDLGRVGVPSDAADMRLLTTLMASGFVPVIACLGLGRDGRLLNVNADTFAGHLAARLGARRLVVAGSTPGVLDDQGATVPQLDLPAIDRLIARRTATAGMVAKLRACQFALQRGVADVVIVDGRDGSTLEQAALGSWPASATRLVA